MSAVMVVIIVATAAAASAALILMLLPWLRRNALAHPNSRSSHRQSTPQGGGLAVIVAALAVSAAATGWTTAALDLASLRPAFAAAVLITLVGAADDLWTIQIAPRLLLQALAVGIMLTALPAELRVVPALPWWIERVLLLLACLWFVNLTNFMDGIDWMTVAEFLPVAFGLALLGYLGALPAHGSVAALALGGALLGFAPFNRPVARLFLGDVGSLPIGLLFGWLLLLLAGGGYWAAALVLPLYYVADATLTLLRRIGRREPFWQAHRTHFYQRATDRGFSVPAVVGRVFATNLALVALAVVSVAWPGPWSAALALGGGAVLVGLLLHRFTRGRP